MMIRETSASELQQLLDKLGAKLRVHEVHALYLGALTSTKLGLGPQTLLDIILGEEPALGANVDEANAAIGVLFGYWNTLLSKREDEGQVRLLVRGPVSQSREELREFADSRRDELQWYVRGIDAGGDDPMELGDDGREIFERLARASGLFEIYIKTLANTEPADIAALSQAHELLIKTSDLCERLISELMDVTDRVRREAMATSIQMQGRQTNDGTLISRATRVGRNESCPCGSGKKWKRCCGSAERIN